MNSPLLVSETPQARFDVTGPSGLSDVELLALLAPGPNHPEQSLTLARELIRSAGSLGALASWGLPELKRAGLSEMRAKRVMAAFEVGRRHYQEQTPLTALHKPELIFDFMRPYAQGLQVEKFWVLCLNRKNKLIKLVELTSGTATTCLTHPREVYRAALQWGATAIACVHNHPSGDPAPSTADLQVTRQLREAARAVDIELLDHIIMGQAANDPQGRGFYSFRQQGLM